MNTKNKCAIRKMSRDDNLNNLNKRLNYNQDESLRLNLIKQLREFDCFLKVRIILLNELGIIFDYKPKCDHRATAFTFETLEEIALGSIGLNCTASFPVIKRHLLKPDLVMNSLIFKDRALLSRFKLGLVVIFDLNQFDLVQKFLLAHSIILDCLMIRLKNNLLKAIKCKSCLFLTTSANLFLNEINSILGGQFVNLERDLNLESFISILNYLIKEIDTKSTNFFLSTLISAVLIYKNLYKTRSSSSSSSVEIIITCIPSQKELLIKLLQVIDYFINNCRIYEANIPEPSINAQFFSTSATSDASSFSSSPEGQAGMEKSTSSTSQSPLVSPSNHSSSSSSSSHPPSSKSLKLDVKCRRSRDESVGYGSLSDSNSSQFESNPIEEVTEDDKENITDLIEISKLLSTSSSTSSNSSSTSASNSSSPSPSPTSPSATTPLSSSQSQNLDQSKLYIKEYQSLRFNNEKNEDNESPKTRKENDKGKPLIKTSLIINTKMNRKDTLPEHILKDDKILTQELLESKELNGFSETCLPELNFDLTNYSKFSPLSSLSHFPFINTSYSPHFKLQGIVLKENEINSFSQPFINSYPCKCSKRPQILIIGNLNTWSVNVTSLESGSTVPGIMCTLIGQLCESLVMLDSLSMNPKFIMAHLECKLNELIVKSQLLNFLRLDEYAISCKSVSESSLVEINKCSQFDPGSITLHSNSLASSLATSSIALGFDASDVPLLSILSQINEDNYINRLKKMKNVKIAETSL